MVRTFDAKEQLYQLKKIRTASGLWSRGAVPPHYAKVAGMGVGVGIGAWVLTSMATKFQIFAFGSEPTHSWVLWVGLVIGSMMFVHHTDKSARRHEHHLDQLLTDYQPVSAEAYRDLQLSVISPQSINVWIEAEDRAIRQAACSGTSYNFKNKKV